MDAPQIGPDQAMQLSSREVLLLDVREDDEWRSGHAPQARHLPIGRLSLTHDAAWRNRSVLVLCRSGSRATRAATLLRSRGVDAFAVRGGMQAWQAGGGPVLTSAGGPGQVI